MADLTTQPSLLSRVRDIGDRPAWREFDAKYGSLILHYCRTRGLQYSDAEDVRQVVMMNLARALPSFHYSPQRGRFRSYLGQVVRNAIARHCSRPNLAPWALDENVLDARAANELGTVDNQWEQEWVRHHLRRAMQTIRATFDPRSVEVFDRLLSGASVDEVATAFVLSSQAVHKIKQRIRNRLRELITQQLREEDDNDHDSQSS